MAAEPIVGIAPHKAARLATALADAGDRLDQVAFDLATPLVDAMEDLAPVVRLLEAGDGLAEHAASLRRLLDEVVGWWREGRLGRHEGIDVWTTPYADAFDDPVGAGRAAEEARRSIDRLASDPDDHVVDDLRQLIGEWRGNPAFATFVAGGIDAGAIVALLAHDRDLRAGEPEPGPRRTAIESVLDVLATASVAGTSPLRFEELEHEVDGLVPDPTRPEGARNMLALLFAQGRRWDTSFVLDAVRDVVLPATRAWRDAGIQPTVGSVDARALVLGAVARDPDAARRLVGGSDDDDLDLLLSSSAAIGDAGDGLDVLGQVLVAATAQPEVPASTVAMARLVEWTVGHHDLPPATRERLGAITAPYLGSFRAATYDEVDAVDHPLRAISPADRRDFLTYAMATPVPRDELRRLELHWLAGQFAATTPDDGPAIATLATVDHEISTAYERSVSADKVAQDDVQAQKRFLSDALESVVADAVPVPVLSAVTSVGLQQLDRHLRPDEHHANEWAAGATARAERDLAIVQTVYVAGLSARGVLDGLPPIPPDVLLGDPPTLRPLDMTPEQVERFHRWLADPAVVAATGCEHLASWGQG